MKYTSIRDSARRRARCGDAAGSAVEDSRDSAGFPACSQALVMIEATPVIASLRRFSKIGRVSGRKVFQSTGRRRRLDRRWPLLSAASSARNELRAFEQRLEHEIPLVLNRPERARLEDELLLVPDEQIVFPAIVKPGLPRQLPVVVEHGVQRHVRIGDVVPDDRREEPDVAARVLPVLVQRLEASNQAAGNLVRAPRQQSVLPELVEAVLLQRLVVRSRQILERVRTVGVDIEKMVWRLLGEACVAPEIGIDRALDDERPVRLEERPNRTPAGCRWRARR